MRSGDLRSRIHVRLPEGALQRIRLGVVAWCAVIAPLALGLLLLVEPLEGGWSQLAVLLGTQAAVAVWAIIYYRADGRGHTLGAAPFVIVLIMGLLGGSHEAFSANLHAVLLLSVLYDRPREQAVALVASVAAVYLAVVMHQGFDPEQFAPEAFGLLVIGLGAWAIARTVNRHERMRLRDAVLTDVTADLLRARSPHEAHRLIVDGVWRLLGGAGRTVRLWRVDNDGIRPVASAGSPEGMDTVFDRNSLTSLMGEPDPTQSHVFDSADIAALQEGLSLPTSVRWAMLAPLRRGDALTGLLLVGAAGALDRDFLSIIQRYANEAALAQALVDRDALFAGIVESSADIIVVTSETGTIDYVSPSLALVSELSPADVVGAPIGAVLRPSGEDRELLVEKLSGGPPLPALLAGTDTVEVEVTGSPLASGGYVLNIRDVSERRQLEAEIEHRAFYDLVTGLANRALFFDRLRQASEFAARRSTPISVLMIDLDDFKSVNDTLGHAAGDSLLVEVGCRLEGAVRSEDTVARFGGDEFVILLPDAQDPRAAIEVADRVLASLREPVHVGGSARQVHASIGISVASRTDPDDILQQADAAMYEAKTSGKDRYVVHVDGSSV